MKIEKLPLNKIKYLKKLNLYDNNYEKVKLVTFSHGECICREGHEFDSVLYIISGRVKISIIASNGKVQLLTFQDNGILGDIEYLTGCMVDTTVTSVGEVKVIKIPFGYFDELIKNNHKILYQLAKGLGEKLRRSSQLSAANSLYTLNNRICGYIIVMSYNDIFNENLTDTSELLNTSYRHLLRVIKKLCEEDVLLKIERGMYKIINKEKLYDLSEGCFIQVNTKKEVQ